MLETASGEDHKVTNLTATSQFAQTYNLTIANNHTFLVGNGQFVVQNMSCDPNKVKKAAEKYAKFLAKKIEKELGKDARKDFHDAKIPGSGDRTKEQLLEDARDLFLEKGLKLPPWLK